MPVVNERIASAGAAAALGLIVAGCDTVNDNGLAGLPGPVAGNNARAVLYETDRGKATNKFRLARANIAVSNPIQGTSADYTVNSDEFHAMTGMTGIGGSFANATGKAQVRGLMSVDEPQDTFLMVTKNNPVHVDLTEHSVAYRGPFTPSAQVAKLIEGEQKATYTGAGGVVGTMAGVEVDRTGSLTLKANFATTGIEGRIDLAPGASAPGYAFDAVSFAGALNDDLHDFYIWAPTLLNGADKVVSGEGRGIGSLVGAKGQGAVGGFAMHGPLPGGDGEMNLLGYFLGSTHDLD